MSQVRKCIENQNHFFRFRANAWSKCLVAICVCLIFSQHAFGQKSKEKGSEQPTKSFDLEFVSDIGGMLAAVRPARALKNSKLDTIVEIFDSVANFKTTFGFSVKQVDQVVWNFDMSRPPNMNLSLKLRHNLDAKQYAAGMFRSQLKDEKLKDEDVIISSRRGSKNETYLWQPDAKRVVVGNLETIERVIDGKIPKRKLLDLKEFDSAKEKDLVILCDEKYFEQVNKDFDRAIRTMPFFAPLKKVAESGESAVSSASVDHSKNEIMIQITVRCTDTAGARDSKKAADDFLKKTIAFVKPLTVLPLNDSPYKSAQEAGLKATLKLLESAKVTRMGRSVKLETSFSFDKLDLDGLLKEAVVAARTAAKRTQSANNGRQMALAFHNYASANKAFPPAVIVGPNGHKHSWRIAMLPYLEQQALYDKYKLDEPWDSKNNLEVMKNMPAVFRHPEDKPDSVNASYFALVGPGTLFDPSVEKLSFRDVRDGTSNTIMYVEAKRDIPWTKPEDIEYDPTKEIPKMGGFHKQGMNVAFGDGSIRFIANGISPEVFHKLIQRDDGNPVRPQDFIPQKKE